MAKAALPLLLIALGNLAGQSSALPVQPFLAKHCYGCHNAKLSSGKLDLTAYQTAAAVAGQRDRWEQVLKKLTAGDMPPQPMPRRADGELRAA